VLVGLAASVLGMTVLAARLSRGRVGASGLALALLVAIGIGVHDLGEGLGIGSSFAAGELRLGAFLAIGFMMHNVTEDLGIAAPATGARVTLWQLAALALVAGASAIAGTWIGGYASSDLLTPVLFVLAAGAALQVVVEVARYVARIAPGGLRSGWAAGGCLSGIAAMWTTGLLVG
jgi:zinc transporter ZupT